MSSYELLPCPFCGGEAVMVENEPTEGFCVVECTYCAAHGPMTNRESAIRLWNTRAERTCELDGTISFDWQATTTTFYTHSLSCGHNVTATETEPPNYCEECGAKVVER